MYIINNIDRPLGIHIYGMQKKYQQAALGNMLPALVNAAKSVSWLNSLIPTTTLAGQFFGGSEVKGQKEVEEAFKNIAAKKKAAKGNTKKEILNQQKNKPIKSNNQIQTFNTARPHNYDKSVQYRQYNGTWQARYTKGKDTNWYNVAEGSTGYDRFGNHNRFKNGKWVKADTPQYNLSKVTLKDGKYYDALNNYIGNSSGIFQGAYNYLLNKYGKTQANAAWKAMRKGATYKNGQWIYPENNSTGDSTPQKSRLDPNRFVSIYDTTGLWKQHAQDNNLTDRDSVRRFQKEVLGFDDTQADGIWGGNTEAAYSRWKANKDAATLQLTSPVKQITVSNTPISRWDTNENLKGRFNNYASMQNYVNSNPEDSFSKAMTTRFGNTNTWNQQDVENALDVAGTYRGSDRRDIANSFNNYYQQQQKTDNNIKNIINNTNQTMNNWRNFTSNLGIFKNGGLISRNPITRFKQGGMLRKLQNGYKIVGTDDQGYPIYQAVDSNAQAQIEAQAAKEVQDFLNSLRASKQQQQKQEFSPVDAINTWKDIITIPKKEVIQMSVKSQKKKSSKNNSNKKNKGSQSQQKITVTTNQAKNTTQFPVDPMPPMSEYEVPQWGRIRMPTAPYYPTRPYSLRQQRLRPNRYGLGDDYYKKTMGFVAP